MKLIQSLVLIFACAALINYVWELAQAPLYVGLESYTSSVLWHCFVAALGDGLMVLIIFSVGALTLRQWFWYRRPALSGYLVMLAAGLILAIAVEWGAVHILGRWEYKEAMPTVPGLGIGLVPLAQMLVLPPIVFKAVALIESRENR